VKDLVTNGLGMTLFGDFPFNPLNVVRNPNPETKFSISKQLLYRNVQRFR